MTSEGGTTSGGTRDPGLDRLRPRSASPGAASGVPGTSDSPGAGGLRDTEGKQALFSAAEQRAAFGGITMTCSHCGQKSVLSGRRALRSLVPSVHVPRPRKQYRSWMRCPACGRRTWVELKLGG